MKKNLPYLFKTGLAAFLMLQSFQVSAQITYSNKYQTARTFINISKPNGGVFDPNDTIEVRYTILVSQSPQPAGGSGAAQVRNILKSAQIIDTLPSNVTYLTGSLKIQTNEGILYKGAFTEAVDADQGDYRVAGANNIVAIRARANAGAQLDTLHGGYWHWSGSAWVFNNNVTPPRFSNNSFCMITYRVKINAAYNQFITFNKAALWFRGIADAVPVMKFKFPQSVIAVFQSPGLCTNGLAISNIFETNGTFGTGKPQNRGAASPIVPTGGNGYTFITAGANSPNDGFYSIVNNTSEAGSTDTTKNGTFATPKIFDVFDIFGDHTGAPNLFTGNAPVDTAIAKPGGGYMLLVNATYFTSAAVSQTVNNVCKNTYYEFSAWFRNVCPRCGADSLGNSSTTWGTGWPANPSYISYAGNDSAGVKPNLSFEINDTTYYTSGNLGYDKTQKTPWQKRGFLFLNSLDSFKITIRNNSPGGGGNDWVMDDVTVSACVPSLKMNFSPFVLGCSDVGPVFVSLTDTIKYSYNGSYLYYKWQRSTNAGASWTDISGTSGGPASPTLINGQWQYTTTYSFLANGATDSGYRYRVIVATTPTNLSSSTCAFTDGSYTYMRFLKCTGVLNADIITFNGALVANKARLNWEVTGEKDLSRYEIEKSIDGRSFIKTGEVQAQNLDPLSQYQFSDNDFISSTIYYRLKMIRQDGLFKYSRVIMLSTKDIVFEVKYLSNPVRNNINIQYAMPNTGNAELSLYNATGGLMFKRLLPAVKGMNDAVIEIPAGFSNGFYTLKLSNGATSISRKIMKTN